jgi:mannose-6-phosphate isomerase-like protein (cupin superfamily)
MKKLRLKEGKPFEMGTRNTRRIIYPAMGAKNLTLNYAVHQPGEEFKQHIHKSSEDVIVVLEGNGIVKLGSTGDDVPIQAGDVIYIPPSEQHGTVNTGDVPLVMISCQAPPDPTLYQED